MKEIIKLILKYHFTIIFILLEVISFSLIVMHNSYQRTVFSGYAASFFGSISAVVTDISGYFHLKETNGKLVAENNLLRNQIEELRKAVSMGVTDSLRTYNDSLRIDNDSLCIDGDTIDVDYVYKTAEMINSGFNKTKNYITINKGMADGIQTEMAVCSSEGVVGVVEKVSRHFAKIIPLINTNLKISAKIKKNGYYGSLQWDGDDYRYSYLNDIPFHVKTEVGDTIVTSGFSAIFPEGRLIGFVESVNRETANFLSIKVRLATDFKRISYIYVIAYTKKRERQQLEGKGYE